MKVSGASPAGIGQPRASTRGGPHLATSLRARMSFEGPFDLERRRPQVKGRAAGRSYLALLSVTLSHRLFRPRAKAASSSRSRCSHSRSSTRLGDVRMDSNRTCSYPLLVGACVRPYHTSSTTTCSLSQGGPLYMVCNDRLCATIRRQENLHHEIMVSPGVPSSITYSRLFIHVSVGHARLPYTACSAQ
jgi:hypothetical protein